MAELPKTSRAAVLTAPRQRVEIREIEILPPEPGAIVVQVEAATVCGTDVHIWEGDLQPEWPVGLGHEMVGRVAALGEGVVRDASDEPLAVGDRIVWAYPWCGKCYYCAIARQPTLCPNARMNGWRSAEKYPFLCGGFADYCYILPECRPVKVPDEVESRVAASATCALRTVVHGFERLEAFHSIAYAADLRDHTLAQVLRQTQVVAELPHVPGAQPVPFQQLPPGFPVPGAIPPGIIVPQRPGIQQPSGQPEVPSPDIQQPEGEP